MNEVLWNIRFCYQVQSLVRKYRYNVPCVRKVLETQKVSSRKSEEKYRIPSECGTFMVAGEGFEPPTSGL